ncbi:methyltransferase domain-containing protein [Haloferax sp. S1W]|uniref:methyltransferase domain-containing protein n=1 Tax=Haloferax sp. S1W TaxID=3377110 RepID=UPI0037C6A818
MTDGDHRPEWNDVDTDADEARAYLDTVTGLEGIQDYKRRSHQLLRPTQGDRILDAGCGMGDDVVMLSERVGPEGEVIGVDKSESLIEEARERTGDMDTVCFRVDDVMQLSFEDGTFDGCRADRVLQHLDDPRGALTEMRRVTRPGGRLTVSGPDWDTCIVAMPDTDTEVTNAVTDSKWADSLNPTIGRRLYALIREVGLTDIDIDPVSIVLTDFEIVNEVLYLEERLARMREAGILSAEQANQWIENARRAGGDELLFGSLTGFTVGGTVPVEGASSS